MGNRTAIFGRSQPGKAFMVADTKENPGNVWYVDSGCATGADAAGYGQNPDSPTLTLDYAIGLATASNGDYIYLLPGHAETLTTAGAVAIDKAGLTIIGIGEGALRPTFTFTSTDNSASILITAASTVIKNILGVCGDDGLTNPFHVQAADCELDFTWRDPANVEAATCILTTSAAARLKINLKYEGDVATGNACVAPITLIGIENADITVDFYGIASTAVIDMKTTASNGIVARGYFYNSGTTDLSKNMKATIGGGKWFVSGYDGAAGCAFSGGSAATLAKDDLSVIASDLVITQSDVKGLRTGTTSDVAVLKAQATSDMTVLTTGNTKTQSDIAAVKSDLVVLQASEDSDMVVIKSDVVALQSNLVVLDAASDSDMTILKSDIAATKSDLVVLQASEDSDMVVIKSDITGLRAGLGSDVVVLKSDIAALASDLLAFRTKYNSDNP